MSLAAQLSNLMGKGLARKFNLKKQTSRDRFRKVQVALEALEEKRRQSIADKLSLKEEKRLQLTQIKQVQYYARLIPDTLARQKLASTSTQEKQGKVKRIIHKIRLLPPVLIHHDYYMFQVDTRRLPVGVSVAALKTPELLETMKFALETEVQVDDSDARGFWYLVARVGGLGILPKVVEWDEIIERMPKRASAWAVPVGVGNNKRLTWIDLRHRPHMLIAGATGAGKSVFIKNLILTLTRNNSPRRLRIILADFKAGPDYVRLVKLPHIGTPSSVQLRKSEIDIDDDGQMVEKREEDHANYLITEPDDLLPVLRWAGREINRRNQKFAAINNDSITNINEYNAKFHRHPLERILLILDEFPVAVLEVDKKEAEQIKKLVSAITRKGRSAGVHVILGSQVGNSEVLSGSISQNVSTRMVGFSTGPQSQVLMGTWFASRISNNPGRMAFKNDLEEMELQTPWINPRRAAQLVEEICRKWSDGRDEDDTATRLFRYALERFEGLYEQDKLHKYFPEDAEISRTVVREIGAAYELAEQESGALGPEIQLDGETYYLLPTVPGKRGRKLILKSKYAEMTEPTRAVEPARDKPPSVEELAAQLLPEVIHWALETNGGYFSVRKANEAFNGRAGRNVMEEISREHVGVPVEINGSSYELGPQEGPKGRKIIPSNVQCPQDGSPDAGNRADAPAWEMPPEPEEETPNRLKPPSPQTPPKSKSGRVYPLGVMVDPQTNKKWRSLKREMGAQTDTEAFEILLNEVK